MAYRGAVAEPEPVLEALPTEPTPEQVQMRPRAREDGGLPAAKMPKYMTPRMRELLIETADVLKISPAELATLIAYETGGTMNPLQKGPTTRWGTHRGLIQFGEPQAKQYGAVFDDFESAMESQLGADGAIVKYVLGHGYKPGVHDGLALYATINAGDPDNIGAKDEAAGGAPGSVADKYYKQMAPFRNLFRNEEWRGMPPTQQEAAIPEQKTPEQKRMEGWSTFLDKLATPEEKAPVTSPVTQAQAMPVMQIETGIPM